MLSKVHPYILLAPLFLFLIVFMRGFSANLHNTHIPFSLPLPHCVLDS